MSDQIDYTELRHRVEARLKRDKSVARVVFTSVNAMMFFLFMLIGWWILLSRSTVSENAIGAMVMLSAGWGTGLFMQVMSTLIDSGRMDQTMRAQAAAREMGRMIAEMGMEGIQDSPKRKREMMVSLSDDGELIEGGQEESVQKRASGARQ